MRRLLLLVVFVFVFAGLVSAQEGEKPVQKGGIGPCLATCCIGPRVGLEMNEGKDVTTPEYIMLGGQLVGGGMTGSAAMVSLGSVITTGSRAYMAYEMGAKKNGFEGALASYCIGPRVGNELDYRKIRTKEWFTLVPCACLWPMITIPLEAYGGKTMTEIEVAEGLRK